VVRARAGEQGLLSKPGVGAVAGDGVAASAPLALAGKRPLVWQVGNPAIYGAELVAARVPIIPSCRTNYVTAAIVPCRGGIPRCIRFSRRSPNRLAPPHMPALDYAEGPSSGGSQHS
jgi:hypothetical protein